MRFTSPPRAELLIGYAVALLLALTGLAGSALAAPNVLLILADDMGYGDLGCLGSRDVLTPHLDRLAAEGVLCTQAYVASSVCSPSRAGLLTGRDPRRFGYEGNLNARAENYATRAELLGLPSSEHTLADQLRTAGYTTALVGKWHLGIGATFHPNARGFDHFCGMLGGGHDYFPTPDQNKLERNGEPLRDFSSPYLTDFFTDEALRWLAGRREADAKRPWFLYLSYNAPHTPMQATEADLARFAHLKDERRRTYAAMMHALDRGIGRVLDELRRTGERDNTLVVFLSDNGGATNNGSWNGPLSGAKGSAREGGIRVPMIVSWPARLPSGAKHDGVVSSLDLLPTFLAAAGASVLPLAEPLSHEDKRNRARGAERYGAYDGVDLTPQLAGDRDASDRTLFYRLQGQAAVRRGPHKLVRLSHRPAQLFRPATDPGEREDLARQDAATLRALFRELGQWEATLPTVPLWDSSPFWSGDSADIYDNYNWRPSSE